MTTGGATDAIILGGGPAGAGCAIWLKQLGFSPVIVERRPVLGGLQNDSPYPNSWIAGMPTTSGTDYAAQIDRQVREFGISALCGIADATATAYPGGFSVRGAGPVGRVALAAPFLVVATGTRARRGGHDPGPSTIIGPGQAVERADFRGKRVAILGGGDNAFENHGFIRAAGAAATRIFARTVRARPAMSAPVPAADVAVGPYRVDQAAMTVNGERFDMFVVLYGFEPVLEAVSGLGLALRPDGFIRTAPETAETSLPGAFAIGDVANRAHPCCATAMADGVVAAKAIEARIGAR